MMDFATDQLRAFVAVVDGGTFDAAARELSLTPSAISQRIKALESTAGRVLLVRSKPVRVTEPGEIVLRLARQSMLLAGDASLALRGSAGASGDPSDADAHPTRVPIVVNADSLATWLLPALARIPPSAGVVFEIYSEDQDHTTALLRDGTAMAAVTSDRTAVPGCTVRPLGRMRYRPFATPEFCDRWFADGIDSDALSRAPVVLFDRKDELQDRWLRRRSRRPLQPPRHYVPASAGFAQAVLLGFGWGLLPTEQSVEAEAAGLLVDLDPSVHVDVPLFWQQWSVASVALDVVAHAVVEGARSALD